MALLEELEELGELEVRKRLANGGFGFAGIIPYIQEWLQLKELEREEARDAHQKIVERDNLRIQRQIRNMTIVVLLITAFTLLVAALPSIEKFFKPILPVSDIQPHQKDDHPTGQNEGKKKPLHGVETVKPVSHK
jgi:hypothetical protein